MKTATKPKRNIWKDPSPYGTYEGERGNSDSWREAFNETWTHTKAEKIINENSPWGILGIESNSSVDTIKSAFRKLMKIHHPDVGGDPEMAKKVMAAYYILMELRQK